VTTAYEDYRDANSRWVDRVPAHWRIERLKFVARPQASNVDKHSKDDEIPVRLCNYTDVYNNAQITADMYFMEATATETEIGKFTLTDDEVIITKDSESWDDIAVPTHVPKAIEGVLCGYHLTQIRPDKDQLDGRYLYYQLCSAALNRQFQVKANGVTRFGLPAYHIDNAETLLPRLDEQRAIVAFLDAQTARIDTLVSHKKRLIDNIEELFIAQVTRAVTKGVNPAAALSNPRTEWFDAFPEHWEIKRLRYVTKYVTTGITPPSSGPDYFVDDGTPWFTPGDFKNFIWLDAANKRLDEAAFSEGAAKRFPARSVLLVGIGATLGKVGFCPHECSSNQQVNAIVCSSEMIPEYLALYLTTRRAMVRTLSNASTLGIINQERTKQIPCLVPPVEEQREIIDQCKAIEDAHIKKRDTILRAIDQLLEYRSAIITAAVTGQIKVV
jgi:type I restriction enzyme S subunit